LIVIALSIRLALRPLARPLGQHLFLSRAEGGEGGGEIVRSASTCRSYLRSRDRYFSRGILAEKKERDGKEKKAEGDGGEGREKHTRVRVCVSRSAILQFFNTVPVMMRIFHLRRDCAQNQSLFKKKKKNLI